MDRKHENQKELGSYLNSNDSYLKNCPSDELENRRKLTRAIFGLTGLGGVYGFENQFEKAIEYFEKALKIAGEQKDKRQEALSYVGLGETYRVNNQFQTAIGCFEKALTVAKR